MSKLKPFQQFVNENDYSDLSKYSLAEIRKLRELGLIEADPVDMLFNTMNLYMEDPAVQTAIETLKQKFDEYTESMFPYEGDNIRVWNSTVEDLNSEQSLDEIGWFEYLMVNR